MRSPTSAWQRSMWPYDDFDDDAVFRIRDRTSFSLILFCSLIIFIVVVFFYTRWLCSLRDGRSGASVSLYRPPPPSDSAVHVFPPMPSRRRGLDPSEIEKMPIVLYQNMTSGGGGGVKFKVEECCICLSAFGDKDRVKVVPQCRHWFHTECLDEWLTSQSSCPLCRASLLSDSPI